jgi:hypothetical protein
MVQLPTIEYLHRAPILPPQSSVIVGARPVSFCVELCLSHSPGDSPSTSSMAAPDRVPDLMSILELA